MKNVKCLILCLLIIKIPAFAQFEYLQFDRLNNGLSTNIVNCIYQDKKGWMWFSTSQGLNQYDGNKLTIFKSNTSEKNSLIGNLVRFVYEDKKGKLWIGTEIGGVNLFNTETEDFTCYYEKDKGNDSIKFSANTIVEDKKGFLWIGTNMGLKKFDPNTGKYITFLNNPNNINSLSENIIKTLFIDNNDILWIGTINGLDQLNLRTNIFEHINLFDDSVIDKSVHEIYGGNDGKIWLGTYSDGLFIYDPVSKVTAHLIPDQKDQYSKTVRTIIQDKKGNYWIGTRNGIFIYSDVTKQFSHFVHDEKNPLSLCHNSVLSLLCDNKGDVWVGTRGGISHLINDKQVFRHFNAFPDDKRFLNNCDIYSFWLDKNNTIWVGTDFGGINIFNSSKNQFSYITEETGPHGKLTSNSIKAMADDGKGKLWIGTYLGGINIYNKNTGQFTYYMHDPLKKESLIDNRIWSIVRDHKGNLWIGTGKGVDFFDSEKGKFVHPNLTEKQVDWIAEDSEYNIWIGTNPDITIVNNSNNSVRKFSVNTRTRSFCEDHLNRIWLTTETKGIMLIDKNTQSIVKTYGEEQGLASNSALSIIEDNQGILWIGTANGLSRFSTDNGKIRNFTKDDGTLLTHYNYGASFKLPSGELLFGGYDGFIQFNPKEIEENEYLPPVIITDFKINNKRVRIGEKGSPLKTHISNTKSITLSYKQNFLTFDYISLNYSTPGNNRYKYKMEGIDDQWIDVGNKREAIYTNLEPGTYTFKVIASNDANQWNEADETSLKIKIVPPFYKTLIFKSILIALSIFVFILILYFRTKRVKLLNTELERLVYKKTKDLQQVAIQLEESQSEVMAQNEEIEKQNEFLKELNEKISLQNRALETYSNDLELKVKDRTSQLHDAFKKAEESDKLKSLILANMSHEIRTPMNSIIGLSNLILTGDITEEDKIFFTQNIKKNCDTLLHLINSVLDLSVIEAGKLALNNAPVNITHFLKDIHQVFSIDKQWLEKEHIDFKLKVPAEDLIIYTDAVRVEQILRNLLHNAFKFTEKGSIELGYASSVNDLILYVKDSGIGIPLSKQNQIFDSFVQLEESTHKSNGNGVGLGLSICWKLTQILGGKLWVISDLNEGSTFYFSLPMAANKNIYSQPLEEEKNQLN